MTIQRSPASGRRFFLRRRRRILAVIAIVISLAVLVVACFGILRLQGNIKVSALRASEVDIPDSSQGLNVLILGSDSREFSSTGFGADTGSQRSDSMLLMHLPPGNGRIEAIQIPRDTVLHRPACEDTGFGYYSGGYGMINSALNYGPACSVAAVEELTGVHLNHFIEVNFEGFISIVNALDGIKVCLNNSMRDSKANLNLPAGQQTLDGPDALALARTRHAIGDGSDIARLGNQQMVMSAIVQRAKSKEVLTRPDRLYAFLDAITSSMTVDPDLSSLAELTGLAARIQAVPTDQITFTTMPTEPAPENPNRVVPAPDAKLIFERISQDIPVNSDKEDHLSRKEEAESAIREVSVLITNGTNVNGLADQYSQQATSSGFTVSGLSNSPTLQKHTRLLIPDSKGAKEAATELAKATKLDIKTTVYEGDSLQLILGQDYADLQVPDKKSIKARSRQANQDLCG